MTKTIALPLILAAALGLAACSDNAQNEAGEALDATATDLNNAAAEAVGDVNAAAADAMAAADNALDEAGNTLDAGAETAANATANTLDDAADATRNASE